MKRFSAYVVAAAVLLACIVACGSKVRIIPEAKLSQIYAEMFMADEWLREHPDAHKTADTTLFYEPVFNKFGYTTEDYIATVDKYMYKPDDFVKVFENAKAILDRKAQELLDMQAVIDGINNANKAIRGYRVKDFNADSLIWSDSAILWYRRDSVALDSLACPDSIAGIDSLVLDSLARVDSLARLDSIANAAEAELRAKIERKVHRTQHETRESDKPERMPSRMAKAPMTE